MFFGFVLRPRLFERPEVRDSRLRAKARLRETYSREQLDNQTAAGQSRFEELAFRGEAAAPRPSWGDYFLDDRFTLRRPKPEELEPIAAEFTYEPVPGVEITVASPEEGWDLWDKACMELHQDCEAAEGERPGAPDVEMK